MCKRVTIGSDFPLIGWTSGASFLSQSYSVLMQNQLLFDSQVKTALSSPVVYVNCFKKRTIRHPLHFDEGIWRRRFRSENASNFFPFTLRWSKTQQSPVILDLCLRKTRSGKSNDYRNAIVFENFRFHIFFPSSLRWNAGVFKFLQFEERFQNASFSWRISVDRRRIRRNRAAFSNSPSVVWTGVWFIYLWY